MVRRTLEEFKEDVKDKRHQLLLLCKEFLSFHDIWDVAFYSFIHILQSSFLRNWARFLFNLLLLISGTLLWDAREFLLREEGPGTIKRFIKKKKKLQVLNGPIFNYKNQHIPKTNIIIYYSALPSQCFSTCENNWVLSILRNTRHQKVN